MTSSIRQLFYYAAAKRNDRIDSVGKYKLARGKKRGVSPRAQGAIPCLVLIFIGFLLVALVFYYGMKAN